MSAIEHARSNYAFMAETARLYPHGCPGSACDACLSLYRHTDAASLDLDNVTAAQFAEFKPDPRLTTPPKDVAS